MPARSTVPLTAIARDAVFIAVGLGVVFFQKGQVQRRAWCRQFEQCLASAAKTPGDPGSHRRQPTQPPTRP